MSDDDWWFMVYMVIPTGFLYVPGVALSACVNFPIIMLTGIGMQLAAASIGYYVFSNTADFASVFCPIINVMLMVPYSFTFTQSLVYLNLASMGLTFKETKAIKSGRIEVAPTVTLGDRVRNLARFVFCNENVESELRRVVYEDQLTEFEQDPLTRET